MTFGFLLLALRDGPVSLRDLVALLGTSKQAVSKLADVEQIYRDLEAGWARTLGAGAVESLRRDLDTVVRAAHDGALPPVRPST